MTDIGNEAKNTKWRLAGYRAVPLFTNSECWAVVQTRDPRSLEWRDIAVFATTEDAEWAVKAINERARVVLALCEILVSHNAEVASDRRILQDG